MSTHIWRLFSDGLLSPHSIVPLDEDEHHFALHVLRLKEGERVEVANGAGLVATGKVLKSDKKAFQIELEDVKNFPKPEQRIFLFLASPKPATLDEVVVTITELGTTDFHIFISEKAASKASPRADKIVKQMRSALRICKLPWQPEIHIHKNLDDALNAANPCEVILFCDEEPIHENAQNSHKHILSQLMNANTKANQIGLVVGPEASFSERERKLLLSNKKCVPVSLGDAILTVPTATAVGLSNIRSFYAVRS